MSLIKTRLENTSPYAIQRLFEDLCQEDISFPCPSLAMGKGMKYAQPARQSSVERKVLKSHAAKERLAWILRRGADAEQVARV